MANRLNNVIFSLFMKDHCVLWERTRDLAKDHGLEMTSLCPMDATCEGSHCVMIEPIKTTANQLDKFYANLEAHQTKKKLADLREELKKY